MNQISAFEYVSILVSIILGLGITQILTSISNLLYNFKDVKLYWTHTIWVVFILFLHIQDWFITYQLKDKSIWTLPEVLFVILYPIVLFVIAKIMLPDNDNEERKSMMKYYYSQSVVLYYLMSIGIALSILFNLLLLKESMTEQLLLIVFLLTTLSMTITKSKNKIYHHALAILILISSMISTVFEKNIWIIK